MEQCYWLSASTWRDRAGPSRWVLCTERNGRFEKKFAVDDMAKRGRKDILFERKAGSWKELAQRALRACH